MFGKIQNLFNSFSLSKKVFILSIVSILIVYSAVALIIYLQTKSKIEHYNVEFLKKEVNFIKETDCMF
ncbi:hypothetical protein V4D30_03220 [Thermodesulfovibrio sp. 3907-1M]|uniref:Sensor histidine kinase n=1 Tax=Thermodesulfovibrio autotrophicus TaxID=3118333 RepID=A0AAU8GXY8_9BACT